jgi:uncharacterized protein (DUF4213/DUF364 family)
MILREVREYLDANLKCRPKLEKIILNSGFTGALLEDGAMGLAMNIRSGGVLKDPELERFLVTTPGRDGLELACDLEERSSNPRLGEKSALLLRSLLVSLLNALSRPLMNEEYLGALGYTLTVGSDRHVSQKVREGETVTIVGYGGMVRNVATIAGKTYVTELEPELFKSTVISKEGVAVGPQCTQVVAASSANKCFHDSDTVFITGCTLVSNTMEEILEQCRGRRIIVYGHTAGLFPEPLFRRGVNIISTGRVTDSQLMVDLLTNCAGAVERFFPQAAEDLQIYNKV